MTTRSDRQDDTAQSARRAVDDDAFHRLADERWERWLRTGESVGWDAAVRYLRERAAGRAAARPVARKA